MEKAVTLKNELPPPNSLVVFESAARLMNFTLAASELNIAQPSVTRQIANLESSLGAKLFLRKNNKIALTNDGERLKASVSDGLRGIAATSAAIRKSQNSELSLACTYGIAHFWLVPRLTEIRSELPDTEIRLIVSDFLTGDHVANADFCIRYGDGKWPGTTAQRLFPETVYPIASPGFCEMHGLRPESFQPNLWKPEWLLHQDDGEMGWLGWRQWFRNYGMEEPPVEDCRYLHSYPIVVDASLRGEGIALGLAALTDDLVESGKAICLGPQLQPLNAGYYITFSSELSERKPARRLLTLLQSI
ncbi:LysR family transcriptional regulator [Roseovarius sp. 2305UL8-3]|uniref:LysR family transcriptional regulator n=1 Tax=Roseovarius conchicola TaxID=3121636 RepID=UPI00352700D1